MSTNVSYNSVTYRVPGYRDTGYAQGSGNLSQYLIALATGSLTLAGGTFNLTAEVDFGAAFGLKALYIKSRTANPASAGQVRLAVTDTIKWNNNAGGGDLALAVNGSDQLTFNGVVVSTGGLSGSGTSGKVPKFTAASTIADGLLSDDGTNITLPSGRMIFPDGAAATPSVSFANDTGFSSFFGTTIRVSVGGVSVGTMDGSSMDFSTVTNGFRALAYTIMNGATPQHTLITSGTTLRFLGAGATYEFNMNANSQFLGSGGTAALPLFTFSGDLNTGIYPAAADELGITGGGAKVLGFPAGFSFKTVSGNESTGATTALLSTNSPAVTGTAPYTWIKVQTSDGSTGYMPVWK